MRAPIKLGLCLGALGVVALISGGCPPVSPWNPPGSGSGTARLVPFSSSSELASYFKNQASASHSGTFINRLFGGGVPVFAEGDAAPSAGGPGGGDDASTSFTSTNIQEAGVDEADIVKTDGTYLYIASGATLRIVRAVPAGELAAIGRVDFDDGYVNELYLYGDRAIAIVSGFGFRDGGPEILIWPPYYQNSNISVYEIDISDPANPAITGRIDLDGSLVSSRLTQERLILVLTIAPTLPANPTPFAINRMTLEQIMPKARTAGQSRDLVPWQAWLRPESPDGYFMTAIVTLDAADVESIVGSTAVVASASTIYATTNSIYLSDAAWSPSGDARETTALHKFTFNPATGAEYVASGSIPGRLLNQFSLSEHEGHLRVATHIAPQFFFGGDVVVDVDDAVPLDTAVGSSAGGGTGQDRNPSEPVNAVYVLAQQGSELEIVGRIEDIAPGERIYSARFMGGHGFLVTFEQIDPLFVLDLADPTQPQIVGELKIPGYSDYLHPLDDTHLIGVGRSVEQTPWGGVVPAKLQLSLFDVSDWSNPTVVQQVEIGGSGSYSEVSYTHKAFTFLPQENLLALPVWLSDARSFDEPWFGGGFSGVLCVQVDPESGFTQLGRLAAATTSAEWFGGVWGMRAVIIGDTVYAASSGGVSAARLSDFQPIGAVPLAPQ